MLKKNSRPPFIKIAISGRIGSGKSTLCHLLSSYHIPILSVDTIVHHLYAFNSDIKTALLSHFGETIISDGEIDRRKIAQSFIAHPENLPLIESLVVPKVGEWCKAWFNTLPDSISIAAVECPLVYETGLYSLFDRVVWITADSSLRKDRAISRGMEPWLFDLLEKRCFPEEEILKKNPLVISNNQEQEALKQACFQLIKLFGGKVPPT